MDAGFDIASSKTLPEGEGEGHAIAYIHRRVMDAQRPGAGGADLPQHVFPAQPAAAASLLRVRPGVASRGRRALPATSGSAIAASGGLSHFLVDEDFDRAILKACADKDAEFLQTLPRNKLNAGSSEILNWVALAGAVEHLDLDWFEYVPGYRTPAGTGTGLSFATWGEAPPEGPSL